MASQTQWTWVWVDSRSWCWTGKPGVLRFMVAKSLTLLSDWTELNSIIVWKLPWTEEPGGLQSMGSQRVWHDWVTTTILPSFKGLMGSTPHGTPHIQVSQMGNEDTEPGPTPARCLLLKDQRWAFSEMCLSYVSLLRKIQLFKNLLSVSSSGKNSLSSLHPLWFLRNLVLWLRCPACLETLQTLQEACGCYQPPGPNTSMATVLFPPIDYSTCYMFKKKKHPTFLSLYNFFIIYSFYRRTINLQCFRYTARWFSYTYTHILFFWLFSIVDYYKILTIVPCTIQ